MLKIYALIALTLMLFSITMFIPTSYSETQEIPSWIQNNARWWSDGEISDSDYLHGIQWLVENDVIKLGHYKYSQTDLGKPLMELQMDPNSNQPAFLVTDGNIPMFTVRNDGSIQIGSNTITIHPDGTINSGGSPLIVQQSVSQSQNLQEWQDSTGTTLSSIDSTGKFSGDGSLLTNVNALKLGGFFASQFSQGPHTVDTRLTEAQVDAFVANNGYSFGPHITQLPWQSIIGKPNDVVLGRQLGTNYFGETPKFDADSNNGNRDLKFMIPSDEGFCYLTQVKIRDTDGGSEFAECEIRSDSGYWVLIADSTDNDDADAYCEARCIEFK